MKKRNVLYGILMIMVVGCSGASVIPDLFVANVSNAWTSDRNSRFLFNADKNDVSQSNFNGEEDDKDGNVNNMNGAFNNYDIHFTFTNGAENGVTYTGKFVKGSNPLQMIVKGTNNITLTITKNSQ